MHTAVATNRHQALETIVYKVKALSETYGLAKACQVNVLKNRHIDGSEVQEVQESEVEVEDEDEEVQQDEDSEQEEVYTLFVVEVSLLIILCTDALVSFN
jgi:hypothetical protein